MSNNPDNPRRGAKPASRSTTSLHNLLNRTKPPLLIPVVPTGSADEIIQRVVGAGEPRVELLVPDGTPALQSVAGVSALRDAAEKAGVRVVIYTADEKTTNAAKVARMEVVSVGGTVTAPQPGATPRRPTGPRLALPPTADQRTAQPEPPRSMQPPPSTAATRPAQPGASPQRPPRTSDQAAPPAASDDDFLRGLQAFEQAQAQEPPRVQESPGGAVLYDVPGDIGVPRPADNEGEWQPFDRRGPDMDEPRDDQLQPFDRQRPLPDDLDDFAPPSPAERRRQQRVEGLRDRTPRPSLLGALFGFLPQRTRRTPDAAPADDEGLRMARPARTPEETAARRRQGRNLFWLPLLALVLLIGVGLIAAAVAGTFDPRAILASLNIGRSNVVEITPALSRAEAEPITIDGIPLVSEPVTDTSSFNVQGVFLSVPVAITKQGQAAGTTLAPIGFAQGTITLRNRSSQAVTIPAGTVVPAGDQQFVVESDVTVPGSSSNLTGITFGVAEVVLTARTPGGQGNIGPGMITAIPGFTGNQGPLVVTQEAAFGGGTDQEVRIVSPDDVNALLPGAVSELYGRGVQEIQTRLPAGFALVEGTSTPPITPTIELLQSLPPDSYTAVFPPIGAVTQDGNFTVQVSQTFQALASPVDQPIEDQLRRAAEVRVRQQRPDLADAAIEVVNWNRNEQGLRVEVLAAPRTGYQQISSDQQAQIVQNIAGKPRAEAQAYLDQLQAQGVIGSFQLPADMETVPAEPDLRITTPTIESNQ